MSKIEVTQVSLRPAQSAELTQSGIKSLALRARADIENAEKARVLLMRGLELRSTAPPDPRPGGPINPYATYPSDLASKLTTVIPRYLKLVLGGTRPDIAALTVRITPEDREIAHVAHFFMSEAVATSQSIETFGAVDSKASTQKDRLEIAKAFMVSEHSAPVPSPVGMDEGVLSQTTVETMGKLIRAFEHVELRNAVLLDLLTKRDRLLREAFQCLQKGSELDATNPDLICWLGNLYFWGQGVERDFDHALTLYQTAADMGHADALRAIEDAHDCDDESSETNEL